MIYNKLTVKEVENWLRNGRKLKHPLTMMEEVMMQLRDALYIIENIESHCLAMGDSVNGPLIIRTTQDFLAKSKVQENTAS